MMKHQTNQQGSFLRTALKRREYDVTSKARPHGQHELHYQPFSTPSPPLTIRKENSTFPACTSQPPPSSRETRDAATTSPARGRSRLEEL